MKNIIRFGVSLEKELLAELDTLTAKHNFPNRSQAIRFLIRNRLVDDAWKDDKCVSGGVIIIYDHHKRELVNNLLDVQHSFGSIILSSQHVHLDHHNCLEMIAVRGKASRLRKLADQLLSLKGIKHGKLVVTAA